MEMLTGKGNPSKYLKAEVGAHYKNTDTGDIFECVSANKHSRINLHQTGGYIWKKIARGEHVEVCGGGGSGGGIQPDWSQNDPDASDYVKNRTHYVETITLLEWDGNKDGLETADVGAEPLVLPMIRVSDTPPQEVYKGMECTFVFHRNGADQSSTVHMESFVVDDNTEFFRVSESAFFVPENAVAGSPFPAPGVWVVDAALVTGDESAYIKSCKAEVVHTIDPKFLPAGGSGGEFRFEITGDLSGYEYNSVTFEEIKAAYDAGRTIVAYIVSEGHVANLMKPPYYVEWEGKWKMEFSFVGAHEDNLMFKRYTIENTSNQVLHGKYNIHMNLPV